MKSGRGIRWICVWAGLATGLSAGLASAPASAGTLIGTPLFEEMVARDFAPEAAIAFAEAADRAGDPDAAIAALEQALLRHPGRADLRTRLAGLYRQIGNAEMARHHAGTGADSAEHGTRTQVWGRASIGMGYETNPTAAESDSTIRVFDAVNNAFLTVLAQEEQPDTLATFTLDLGATHQLTETALLAADLSIDGEIYREQRTLDNVTGALAIGPWLGPGQTSLGEIYVRPYLAAGIGTLDGQPYYSSIAGGAELRFGLGPELAGSAALSLGRTDYNGRLSDSFPVNRLDNTALSAQAGLSGTGPLSSAWSLVLRSGVVEADAVPESYLFFGAGGAWSVPLNPVRRAIGLPATVQLGGSLDHYRYRSIDVTVDPTNVRRDSWVAGKGTLTLGLTETLDLTIGADYVRKFSNIAAFDSETLRLFYELGYSF